VSVSVSIDIVLHRVVLYALKLSILVVVVSFQAFSSSEDSTPYRTEHAI
jgi:hypothetical protein